MSDCCFWWLILGIFLNCVLSCLCLLRLNWWLLFGCLCSIVGCFGYR